MIEANLWPLESICFSQQRALGTRVALAQTGEKLGLAKNRGLTVDVLDIINQISYGMIDLIFHTIPTFEQGRYSQDTTVNRLWDHLKDHALTASPVGSNFPIISEDTPWNEWKEWYQSYSDANTLFKRSSHILLKSMIVRDWVRRNSNLKNF